MNKTQFEHKEDLLKNTYELNELLSTYNIREALRSQFVGTCLLALKEGFDYEDCKTITNSPQLINRIEQSLETFLTKQKNDMPKTLSLITTVFKSQEIQGLHLAYFKDILRFIELNILPFINDKSAAGQDLLNLFFTTFNKYVGKDNKNQAFTPDHITDFMAKITGVNKNTVVLDPCCGSGAFLVRAMTQALDDCATKEEQELVKKNHIFGIEYDENVYGLATTNMLIHGDGNSNIEQGNCFNLKEWIKQASPDIILMNPPYNAQKKHLSPSYTETWGSKKKEDPTKGLCFVKYVADIINELGKQAKLAVLLPVACAIGSSKELKTMKNELLKQNTLDAVFTLPDEIFYPGASTCACCMVFTLGKKHSDTSNPKTYFGYYKEDGFKKRKNLGRVEQVETETGKSLWSEIEEQWIELYTNRQAVDGLSAVQKVNGTDEWLCEAYMRTDYTKLTESDFQQTLNNYLAYLIKEGNIYES